MTDLLLYFALAALATIGLVAGLAWLTRPVRKMDKLETPLQETNEANRRRREMLVRQFRQSMANDMEMAARFLANENDPLVRDYLAEDDIADSFTPDELWEAAAKMHRETPDEKATIDRWEREMHENAGKE